MNQAIEQVRELFLSMTPAARLTAVLLVGVIGISLGFLFQQQSTGPDEYLFGGEILTSHEANQVEAAIAQAGLGSWERTGNRIRVPRGHKAEYWGAVGDAGALPTNIFDETERVMKDAGAFTSSATKRELLKADKQRQLSQIISAMDGIENAQVIYDITKPRGLYQKPTGTATVSVRPTSDTAMEGRQIEMIKRAVAGALTGLAVGDVQVINESGFSYGGTVPPVTSQDFPNDPYFQNRINFEQLMVAKFGDLLSYIPGVRIAVTAELDDTSSHTTQTITPEGEAAALRDSNIEEETSSLRKENGGRPGPVAQGPARTGAETALATTEETTSSVAKETDNFIGTSEEIIEQAGFIPKRIRASIVIPSNYLMTLWHENNPGQPEDSSPEASALVTLEDSVRTKIKNSITPLLPRLEKGVDPYDQVALTILNSITPPPIEGTSMTNHALAWLGQNANSMMMGGLALASLFMLHSVVKSIPSNNAPAPSAASDHPFTSNENDSTDRINEDETEDEHPSRPRLQLRKGDSLKDDLADIVNDDPEAAASILRGWIDSAA